MRSLPLSWCTLLLFVYIREFSGEAAALQKREDSAFITPT